ncbi:hypothetical protein PUN28_009917 [Cardiocondyla obscurior]|uniref:Uncharacterized protein n=1 Tax=Cardiocondyla obscurior TaxID=286306 RepID=A0AAW2FPC2_9HYME
MIFAFTSADTRPVDGLSHAINNAEKILKKRKRKKKKIVKALPVSFQVFPIKINSTNRIVITNPVLLFNKFLRFLDLKLINIK